jgi:septum formation protein
MLLHVLDQVNALNIVLASKSPRRKEILEQVGVQFTVRGSHFEETLDKATRKPHEYVQDTAQGKCDEVWETLQAEQKDLEDSKKCQLVISADTVVCLEGKILEKPRDTAHAIEMISALSGRAHTVYTGVCLRTTTQQRSFYVATQVTFAALSPELVAAYVQTGEPMDKAGGYGIQGKGGSLVQGIEGDYYNVVGLPLQRLCEELTKLI